VCTISGFHSRTVYDIDWCHLTGDIVTAGGDDTVRVFRENGESGSDRNKPSFDLVALVRHAHLQDVNSAAWNPAVEGLLATCSDDGSIKIWDLCAPEVD
jgi:WD40 repeat protein